MRSPSLPILRGRNISTLFDAIGFGLVTAAVIALAATAVSLQVSVTNFVNFAYGDFMTFGAYIAWQATDKGLNLVEALILGGIATGVLGVLANVFVFRPFIRRGLRPVTLLIAGVAISFILQSGITMVWSAQPQRFPVSVGASMQVGPFALTPGDIVIILGSGSLLLALHLMLAYTKFGKSLRATSNNSDLAQACGINSDRVINMTWFIAGLLTAAAGVALSLEESSLLPSTGFTELFVIFGAVVLGGIGRPYGAMLGALVVGMLTELSGMYANPAYKSAIAFVVVIVVLLIRPQGILSAAGKTS